MSGAKLFYQFSNAAKLALLAVFVKSVIQTAGEFLGLDLQQDAIEQRKMLGIHALNFFVQYGLQFFRLNGQWL
jgi:hypothetical protein